MGERSLTHLDDTIREILEYSRNTRLGPVNEKFDVLKLVEQVFADLKFSAGMDMHFEAEIIGATEIYSDRSRFNTVIRNIISNSVKYRKKNSTDSFVRFNMRHVGNKIVIDISDNGEGISSVNLEKVFDMFFRGTSTGMGTGLGLYICKEILVKIHGTISLESELGKGTTVHIELQEQD
jgi:signal transduction histidine kinase